MSNGARPKLAFCVPQIPIEAGGDTLINRRTAILVAAFVHLAALSVSGLQMV